MVAMTRREWSWIGLAFIVLLALLACSPSLGAASEVEASAQELEEAALLEFDADTVEFLTEFVEMESTEQVAPRPISSHKSAPSSSKSSAKVKTSAPKSKKTSKVTWDPRGQSTSVRLSPPAHQVAFRRFVSRNARKYRTTGAAALEFSKFTKNREHIVGLNDKLKRHPEAEKVFKSAGPFATWTTQEFKKRLLNAKNPRKRSKKTGKSVSKKPTKQVATSKFPKKPSQKAKKAGGRALLEHESETSIEWIRPEFVDYHEDDLAAPMGHFATSSELMEFEAEVAADSDASFAAAGSPPRKTGAGHTVGTAGGSAGKSGRTAADSGGSAGKSGKSGGQGGETAGKSGKTGGGDGSIALPAHSGAVVSDESLAEALEKSNSGCFKDGCAIYRPQPYGVDRNFVGKYYVDAAQTKQITRESVRAALERLPGINVDKLDRTWTRLSFIGNSPGVGMTRALWENNYLTFDGRAFQQGQCGSCWAETAVNAVQKDISRHRSSVPRLSVQQLLDCVKTEDSNGCLGGTPMDALDWLAQNAVASSSDYPRLDPPSSGACRPAPSASQLGILTKGWQMIAPACPDSNPTCKGQEVNELALIEALETAFLPIVYVDATNWQHYSGGLFPVHLCSSSLDAGNHVVEVAGYGYHKNVPNPMPKMPNEPNPTGLFYWVLRNTWSEKWGEYGYIRVPMGINACGVANFMIRVKSPS
jgi:hypothetical protein